MTEDEGLPRYPGSTQTLRSASAEAVNQAAIHVRPMADRENWGSPRIKTVRGVEFELYGVGSLARALGRTVSSMRLWERQGNLPPAPFIFRGRPGPRGNEGTRRYYSARSIEAAVKALHDEGLLTLRSIQWEDEDAKRAAAAIRAAWDAEKQEVAQLLSNA